MKLCAIGRFRELAQGYHPHRHTDRMLPCASLAKRIARHVYSSCHILLSVPTGTERICQVIYNQRVSRCFPAVSEFGGIAVVLLPGHNQRTRQCLPRQDCSSLFSPVVAVFPVNCPCFHPRQECSGLFDPVVAVFPVNCPCFPAATGLSRPVQSCRGHVSGELSVLSCRDRIIAACSVLSWPCFR